MTENKTNGVAEHIEGISDISVGNDSIGNYQGIGFGTDARQPAEIIGSLQKSVTFLQDELLKMTEQVRHLERIKQFTKANYEAAFRNYDITLKEQDKKIIELEGIIASLRSVNEERKSMNKAYQKVVLDIVERLSAQGVTL